MLWVRLTEMFVLVGFVRMYHLNFSFHSISCFLGCVCFCIFTPFSRHSIPVSHILLCSYTPLLPGHGPGLICGLILTCALLRRAEERPEPFSIQRAAAAADASSEGASGKRGSVFSGKGNMPKRGRVCRPSPPPPPPFQKKMW